jgi:hypothetical protein
MHLQKPMRGTPLDWSNPLNKGLRMHIAMNEGHGDKVQDLSMNGNHGTLNNFAFPSTVASGWNPGRTGVVPKFDGVDDYVDCGNNESLNTDHLTLSAWFNPTTGGFDDSKPIIQKALSSHVDPYYQYSLNYINRAGMDQLNFHITVGGTRHDIAKGNSGVISDAWNQIAATYDGITAMMYLNGQAIHSASPCSGNITQYNGYLNIGAYSNLAKTSDYVFKGSIDQPRVLNRGMTAKEILNYHINPWQVYLDEDD